MLLKMSVAPSMETKVKNEARKLDLDEFNEHYTIHLEFESLSKKLLCCFFSMCGCYDGCHACSHATAFLLFITCVQKYDVSKELFEKATPGNSIALQFTLTLIENVYTTDGIKKTVKRNREENDAFLCDDSL